MLSIIKKRVLPSPLLRTGEILLSYTYAYHILLVTHGIAAFLADYRHVNYGHLFLLPWDNSLPLIQSSWLLIPYLYTFIFPIIVMIVFQYHQGFQRRHLVATLMGITLFSCINNAFFLLLPTNATDYFIDTLTASIQDTDGTLADWLFLIMVKGTVGWNAFPSNHLTIMWFFLRRLEGKPRLFVRLHYFLLLLTFAATFLLKVHFIVDGLVGIAIAECCWRLTQRLERRSPRFRYVPIYGGMIVAIFVLALSYLYILHHYPSEPFIIDAIRQYQLETR